MKRWLRRLLFGLVCLFVVLAVVWTVWNFRANRRLEAALEALKEDGVPTQHADLQPEPVPANENAAPYYKAALALLETVPREQLDIDPLKLSDEERQRLPLLGPALEMAYRAAVRPRCNFGLEYDEGLEMDLSYIVKVRKLTRVLAARAMARAQDGDVDGAFDDLRVIFRVSRAVGGDSVLVCQLVRFDIAREGLRILERIFPIADAAAKRLEEIDPDAGKGGIASGLRSEVASSLGLLNLRTLARVDVVHLPSWWGIQKLVEPYLKSELAFWLETTRLVMRSLRKPYPEALDALKDLEGEADRDGGIIARMFASPILTFLRQEAVLASRTAMARLAAELLDYRRREGTFPADLDALGRNVDTIDPLTGKPFVLRSEGGEVFLVSQDGNAFEEDRLRWVLDGGG